tara:strand:- start:1463 stop:1894 length:432 start_codon:yes stop_codon:yes gene_type:complete
MAAYIPTSWGRTRRPKHVREQLPPTKQTATTVTAVTSLSADLNSGDPGKNGYATENQRYLHVLVSDASSAKSVDIYGYNYAFGEWAPLMLSLGNATFTKATATAGGSGADPVREYIFEIAGVDRVAFFTADAPTTVRAACSTF